MRLRNFWQRALFAFFSGPAMAMPDAGALFRNIARNVTAATASARSDRHCCPTTSVVSARRARKSSFATGARRRRCRASRQALRGRDQGARRFRLFPTRNCRFGRPGDRSQPRTRRFVEIGKPVYSADPLNLFVVVEAATIMSRSSTATGSSRSRFESRFALHGAEVHQRRSLCLFGSRDGWVTKYDLRALRVVAEVRGINARNIALSKDGRHVAVANYLPNTLVLLSATICRSKRSFPADRSSGQSRRAFPPVYQAPDRELHRRTEGFCRDMGNRDKPAGRPVYAGLVHNYENPWWKDLCRPPDSLRCGASRSTNRSTISFRSRLSQSDRRKSRRWQGDRRQSQCRSRNCDHSDARHAASGFGNFLDARWAASGRDTSSEEGKISIIDTADWKVVKMLITGGPGFFLRSHEGTPYIWADSFLSRQQGIRSRSSTRTAWRSFVRSNPRRARRPPCRNSIAAERMRW